jgi:hypothetical protein
MDNTGFVEVTTKKEEKSSEIDSTKMLLNCPGQTTTGLEKPCKCGAFFIPLCIVI